MPVLPLDCHLPTQNTTHTIKLQQWTNNKRNKGYKQLIYISQVNVTQTVPDISPLMPMHQDPLLVLISDLTRDLDFGCFKVKFRNSCIFGIVGLIDVKWKRSKSIGYWADCMTLPFDHIWSWSWSLKFRVWNSLISGMGWLIDMERKECKSSIHDHGID